MCEVVLQHIEKFVQERIIGAAKTIREKEGLDLIKDEDVILTYKRSILLEKLFIKAKEVGKLFRVVIVEGCGEKEGRKMLHALNLAGIDTTYTSFNGIPHAFERVTKTFLSAECMYANGAMLAEAGTATIAIYSKSKMIPVVAFSEMYKFSQNAMLGNFVSEEHEKKVEFGNGS